MLYTREFFESSKAHLNPGGVVTLFVQLYESNTEAVKSEIAHVLRGVSERRRLGQHEQRPGYDLVLLGQVEPTQDRRRRDQAKLQQPGVRAGRAVAARDRHSTRRSICSRPTPASAPDLQPWLKDAQINRDRNLRLQYLAGLGLNLYQSDPIYADMLAYAQASRRACSPGRQRRCRRCVTAVRTRIRDADRCRITAHDYDQSRRDRSSSRVSPFVARCVGVRGRRRRRVAAAADTLPARLTRSGVLEASRGLVRAERLLPVGQPAVERDLVPGGHPGSADAHASRAACTWASGPEQNFTYIAALKPKMVFITDIRRGNLHMQLMYKALFELSADRADFVALLFTRSGPTGLTDEEHRRRDHATRSGTCTTSPEAVYKANSRPFRIILTKTHGCRSRKDDLRRHRVRLLQLLLVRAGASTTTRRPNGGRGGGGNMSNYGDLMMHDRRRRRRAAAIWRPKRPSRC